MRMVWGIVHDVGVLFPYDADGAVGSQFDDARWRMGEMFLSSCPAYIVHGICYFRDYIAIVLRCRLSADVGTCADKCFLQTVAQLF